MCSYLIYKADFVWLIEHNGLIRPINQRHKRNHNPTNVACR